MYQLREYQQKAVDAACDYFANKNAKKPALIVMPTGCHEKGTLVIKATGETIAVENIKVGDLLLSPSGKAQRVLELHRGYDAMYKVVPIRGKEFVVNKGHILSLMCTRERNNPNRIFPSTKSGGEVENVSISDYLTKSKHWRHLRKLYYTTGVEFPVIKGNLIIPPYILGLILGDGCVLNGGVSVTTMDSEIEESVLSFAKEWGLKVRKSQKKNNRAFSLHFSKEGKRNTRVLNKLSLALRRIGIMGVGSKNKFIPHVYKTSSIEDRKQILAGLLDTDGSLGGNGFDFISKSERLSKDVAFIARSLGLFVKETECYKYSQNRVGGVYYRLCISGHTDIIPCRIPRKQATPRKQIKNSNVTGFNIFPAYWGDYYGFSLTGDNLYMTDDFMVHHNSGKSLIVAEIARRVDAPLIVFQPTREILEQNYNKMMDYGIMGVTIYSASMNSKEIGNITLATIGSVHRKPEDFSHFKYVIVDECHGVNAKAENSMYTKFLKVVGEKIIGLTATPYRLSHDGFGGSILKFLTRTNPRVFSRVIHVTQTKYLSEMGYFSPTEYFPIKGFNRAEIRLNSTGADYIEESERAYYDKTDFNKKIIKVVKRLLEIGKTRILVFTKFVQEAKDLAVELGDVASTVDGEMKSKDRDAVIKGFKSGQIKVVCNVGVLTTGFDYPELEVVVIARPTRSLTLYYQMCLDLQTEILTRRGFLYYGDVLDTDLVATYQDGCIKWSKINQIIYRETYEGEKFVSFKNQHLDFRVTGEHIMLAKSSRMRKYQKETALEMTSRTTMLEVPISGMEPTNGCNLTDDEIRFLGFFLSDGHLHKTNNSITIVQSLRYPHIIAEIERVLISCGLKYGKAVRVRKGEEAKYLNVYHFTVSKGTPRGKNKDKRGWGYLASYVDKSLSDPYNEMNAHQFDVLLEALNMGDGRKFKPTNYISGTINICMGDNKVYADRIQSLCIRRGYRCNMYTQRKTGYKDQYILRIKKRDTSTIAGVNVKDNIILKKKVNRARPLVTEPQNTEFVWCVNTDAGTIITRRNGKPLIMGNCGRIARPHPAKEKAWIVDMCGNYDIFGRVEDMQLVEFNDNIWSVVSKGRQLTNVYLGEIMKD